MSLICFMQTSDSKTFLASQKCITAESVVRDCLMGVLVAWGYEYVLVCFRTENSVFTFLKTTYSHARNGLT